MQIQLTPEEELACSANQPLFYKVITDMLNHINDLEPLEFLRAKIIIWSVALVVKSMSPVKILIPPEVLSNEKDGLREAQKAKILDFYGIKK